MSTLTEKQQNFAVNKAAGVKNRDAAVAAGYAVNSAEVTASKLMARADIKTAIRDAKRKLGKGDADVVVQAGPHPERHKMPKAKYTDSKEFLIDAMNNKYMPVAARAEYAKALLPYQHARIGEKGKKETAKDRATDAVSGKHKFAPKQSPKLHAIQGGKK